ncbi:MAG: hypothetical protein HY268_24040 [Deltaproteobacteria bacterium]|nr:hypothetical protein [Deltaproteobacteria bacterium]
MKFSEVVEHASALLQRKGRLSYRTLKLEFDLSDEQLEALKEELIEVQELAVDKDGKMLVWTGATSVASSQLSVASSPQPLLRRLRTPNSARPSPQFPTRQRIWPTKSSNRSRPSKASANR